MTTDDDRIAHLAGERSGALDDVERADLDDLRAMLADPAVWAEPDAGLEDAVVAAIGAEASASAPPEAKDTGALPRRRRHGLRPWPVIGVVAAAAAVVVAVMIATSPGDEAEQLAASLGPTDVVPGAQGYATLTETESGWRIELDATGLPRLDDGRFYQAWLRNEEGVLVAIGSFNAPEDVVLWAGVNPIDFRVLTVTEEAADGDPASSGRRVLVGPVTEG